MYSLTIEFFASVLIWFMFAGLLILYAIDGKIKKEEVLHAIFAFVLAWIIAEIVKQIAHTQRPLWLNGHGHLTLTGLSLHDGAFPSAHSAAAFALATTIWLHDRRIGWIYLVCAAVVGIARVLANVHYPVDIFGGAVLGILTAFAAERLHFFKLLIKLKRKIGK
jgi:undecaprenyl-diphosphatase